MSGYLRIVEACRAGGYPVPEWQELGAVVRVIFQPHLEAAGGRDHDAGDEAVNEAVNEAANERQRWVLGQLASGRAFRTATLQEQFGCSRATAQRDLADLVGRGLIEFVGARKTGTYRLGPRLQELGGKRLRFEFES